MGVIEKLYFGNLSLEKRITSPVYSAALSAVCDKEERLRNSLGQENQKLLADLLSSYDEMHSSETVACFTEGFRLGAKFILDIFEKECEGENEEGE